MARLLNTRVAGSPLNPRRDRDPRARRAQEAHAEQAAGAAPHKAPAGAGQATETSTHKTPTEAGLAVAAITTAFDPRAPWPIPYL